MTSPDQPTTQTDELVSARPKKSLDDPEVRAAFEELGRAWRNGARAVRAAGAALPEADRLAVSYWTLDRFLESEAAGRSYRGLIYGAMNFGPEAYVSLQMAGLVDLHNLIDEPADLRHGHLPRPYVWRDGAVVIDHGLWNQAEGSKGDMRARIPAQAGRYHEDGLPDWRMTLTDRLTAWLGPDLKNLDPVVSAAYPGIDRAARQADDCAKRLAYDDRLNGTAWFFDALLRGMAAGHTAAQITALDLGLADPDALGILGHGGLHLLVGLLRECDTLLAGHLPAPFVWRDGAIEPDKEVWAKLLPGQNVPPEAGPEPAAEPVRLDWARDLVAETE